MAIPQTTSGAPADQAGDGEMRTSGWNALRWFRVFLAGLGGIDLVLGSWLLVFPESFLQLMGINATGEHLFVRESGSYMLFASVVYLLAYLNPVKHAAVCQATIFYRLHASVVEAVAVLLWLEPGFFRNVFTFCAFNDALLGLVTVVLMHRSGVPWNPFRK